ncbi:MAG: type II toxin-antitoxin system VapC family toxin [Verrucomicrobiae bacterium]|nr:type II toxin-antitoxin system VapC family toxin [Verrucomicrobiae bacterium]MCB1090988.1 type II toxin-antitoxin system VapC family toxin [Verrucomicrobiae bacterium]MCB1235967.1 type II toxin-antitoxin system VapC family toxin [Verrucomicrobiae bacterium]
MKWLLDTNVVIHVLKDIRGGLANRLAGVDPSEVCICSVVEAELYHGATKYGAPARRKSALEGFLRPFASLPFDSPCVPVYARIRDRLEREGRVIGGNDLMIASVALTHDLTLVTTNTGEFSRIAELRIEDWNH